MSKAQYDDGLASLYLADARSMDFLPDNSCDVIITSPPYFSLRKYPEGAKLVWDALEGCEHVWGDRLLAGEGYADASRTRWQHVGGREGMPKDGFEKEQKHGQFCQLCGAWRGQLGLEPTIELYLDHLLQILDTECKRVLRDTGVMWVNMGDSYASGGKSTQDGMQPVTWTEDGKAKKRGMTRAGTPAGLKPLDRCTIPWRFAMAMQQRGWYLRREIVWVKPNPMPESPNGWRWEQHRVKVKPRERGRELKVGILGQTPVGSLGTPGDAAAQYVDCPGCPKCLPNDGLVLRKGNWRPTTSHEWIFMLTKSNSYFCDAEAVREGDKVYTRRAGGYGGHHEQMPDNYSPFKGKGGFADSDVTTVGRNLRSVWEFPTQNYKEAHFATFPLELPTRCIKASTSERGNCPKCGMPWVRCIQRKKQYNSKYEDMHEMRKGKAPGGLLQSKSSKGWEEDALQGMREPPRQSPIQETHQAAACPGKALARKEPGQRPRAEASLSVREGQGEDVGCGPEIQTHRAGPSNSKEICQGLSADGKGQDKLAHPLLPSPGIANESRGNIHSGRLDADTCKSKPPLFPLSSDIHSEATPHDRSSNSPYERRKARPKQHSGSVPSVQLSEAQSSHLSPVTWRPSCGCDAGEPVPAVCLDPFTGSGTTNAAATKLGRASIGVDCVEEYLHMAIKRIQEAHVAVQEAHRDAGRSYEVKVEGVKVKQEGLWEGRENG